MRYRFFQQQPTTVSIPDAGARKQSNDGFLQGARERPEQARKSSLESWIKASASAISVAHKEVAKHGFVI
jgi:hypothetical protein